MGTVRCYRCLLLAPSPRKWTGYLGSLKALLTWITCSCYTIPISFILFALTLFHSHPQPPICLLTQPCPETWYLSVETFPEKHTDTHTWSLSSSLPSMCITIHPSYYHPQMGSTCSGTCLPHGAPKTWSRTLCAHHCIPSILSSTSLSTDVW